MDADNRLKKQLDQVAQEEPKIVAEWRINVNPAQQFLEEYNHCCLCGSELMFTHQSDYLERMVTEEAHCPSCSIRTKKEIHGLH